MTDSPAIVIDALSLGYGSTSVLDTLSLSIPRGKITVLAGPNGCGKSTLLARDPAPA